MEANSENKRREFAHFPGTAVNGNRMRTFRQSQNTRTPSMRDGEASTGDILTPAAAAYLIGLACSGSKSIPFLM